MNLTNFKWINGTEDNPIILSKEQLDKLLNFAKNNSFAVIEGYVTCNTSYLYDSYVYELTKHMPNLHILNIIKHDELTIETTKDVYNEDETATITVTTDSGIIPEIAFKINEHTITGITDSNVIAEDIIDSYTFKQTKPNECTFKHTITNVLKRNVSWNDRIKIEIKYNDVVQTKYITFRAIAVTNVQFNPSNTEITLETNKQENITYTLVPSNSTKTIYVNKSVNCDYGKLENISNGWKYTAPNEAKSDTLRIQLTILNNIYDKIYNIHTVANDTYSIRIVQDDTYMLPTEMIRNADENESKYNPSSNKVMSWIKENIKIWATKIDNNQLLMARLSNEDKNNYFDGTSAVNDLLQDGVEVYVQLPKFYLQSFYTDGETNDKNDIIITTNPNNIDINNSLAWNENILIGAYDSVLNENDNKAYSAYGKFTSEIANITPENNIISRNTVSSLKFGTLNYDLYRYILALIWFDQGTVNTKSIYTNDQPYNFDTGGANIYGISSYFSNLNNKYNNFLGIENLFVYPIGFTDIIFSNYDIKFKNNVIAKRNNSSFVGTINKLKLNEELIFDYTDFTSTKNVKYLSNQATLYIDAGGKLCFLNSGDCLKCHYFNPSAPNKLHYRLTFELNPYNHKPVDKL